MPLDLPRVSEAEFINLEALQFPYRNIRIFLRKNAPTCCWTSEGDQKLKLSACNSIIEILSLRKRAPTWFSTSQGSQDLSFAILSPDTCLIRILTFLFIKVRVHAPRPRKGFRD